MTKVNNFLTLLQKLNMTERLVVHGQTVISITNYELYNRRTQKKNRQNGHRRAKQTMIQIPDTLKCQTVPIHATDQYLKVRECLPEQVRKGAEEDFATLVYGKIPLQAKETEAAIFRRLCALAA